ncbi:hypothetical protein N7512_005662 [Penicillium capsulatum]|nr:hypothetical protein N7512_005662 [Penicillium capsulatum]
MCWIYSSTSRHRFHERETKSSQKLRKPRGDSHREVFPFANDTLPDNEVTPHLSALIQSYLSTMSSIGAETWIMHGTLLAWRWNQKIFPWDNDLDVQISEPTIHFLAEYYNMTEHEFDLPHVSESRRYLLEINPNYVVSSSQDRLNVIDGRWIDKYSGLFIDITAVRRDDEQRNKGHQGALMCKDKHRYDICLQESQIFPLRDSYFEGMPVKIPYAYADLLVEEHGARSLSNTEFHDHQFDETSKAWEEMKSVLGKGHPSSSANSAIGAK